MAIYGIGAYYGSNIGDVSPEFISKGYACVGWKKDDAETIHKLIHRIEDGDIIYIKSYPQGLGLYIKAVGIVIDNDVKKITHLGEACVRVKWIWTGKEKIGKIEDGYNVRANTLYEEIYPKIRQRVLKLLLSKL